MGWPVCFAFVEGEAEMCGSWIYSNSATNANAATQRRKEGFWYNRYVLVLNVVNWFG
jgi:hypothetical protein